MGIIHVYGNDKSMNMNSESEKWQVKRCLNIFLNVSVNESCIVYISVAFIRLLSGYIKHLNCKWNCLLLLLRPFFFCFVFLLLLTIWVKILPFFPTSCSFLYECRHNKWAFITFATFLIPLKCRSPVLWLDGRRILLFSLGGSMVCGKFLDNHTVSHIRILILFQCLVFLCSTYLSS